VADKSTLDMLEASLKEAEGVAGGTLFRDDAHDHGMWTARAKALRAELEDEVAAASASHDTYVAEQAATDSARGGSSGGGGTAPVPAPGIVTWGTCDGDKQDKYIDGEYAGNRGCTTVAYASAAVAP